MDVAVKDDHGGGGAVAVSVVETPLPPRYIGQCDVGCPVSDPGRAPSPRTAVETTADMG